MFFKILFGKGTWDHCCHGHSRPLDANDWETPVKEKFYILTFLDVATLWLQIYPISDIFSITVVNSFKNYIQDFGLPKRILSDNDTQYISSNFVPLAIKKHFAKFLP